MNTQLLHAVAQSHTADLVRRAEAGRIARHDRPTLRHRLSGLIARPRVIRPAIPRV